MAQKRKPEPNTILRRLRQERGWSLQRVADELQALAQTEDENRMPGVNTNTVGTWERGSKKTVPLLSSLALYPVSPLRLTTRFHPRSG